MTIDCWIADTAASNPDKTALIYNQQSVSYTQFSKQISDKASNLIKAGVSHGDRIAWYGLNHPDVFTLLFACAKIGAILVPLNWRLAEPEVAAIVANCTPVLLFYDNHFSKQALALPNIQTVSVNDTEVPECSRDSGVDRENKGAGANNQKDNSKSPEKSLTSKKLTSTETKSASTNDPVLLVYTSGSTGHPKGALLSQKSLISNARMSVHAHNMTSDDTVLVILPLFHVGGLNILPTPAFSIGATVLLHERFDPNEACLDLKKATLVITVPTVLQAMIKSQHWLAVNVSTLKGISIGSTDVPIALIDQVHALNIPMIQVYGATETGPFAIYQTIDEAMTTVGSIGRAGCDCQIRLVTDGKDASAGEPGEIWVKGDNVLIEYWQDAKLTNQMLQDSWFRTGDVATLDANGLYWFNDRIKHVIISGGENIYPTEIERLLMQLPAIREAAVVGVADARWGEIPVAVVVANEGTKSADVLLPLEGQLARYKHPKKVVFVEALPRNAMGKVVAANVRDMITS